MAERRASTAQAVRQTLQQLGAEATRELREALRLAANPNDTAILGTALARAAARETRRNPQFADEVRREYNELAALRRNGTNRTSTKAAPELLVPIRHLEVGTLDPYAPPNPRDLIYVYGQDKLARALQEYTRDMLKETAAMIERQHPGTKPSNRGQKEALITYIVKYSQA